MDKLKKMALFCRVVELGSFAAVADDQGVTPAIVGRHVADLENLLGLRLLSRTTRSMEVTDEGRRYYKGCRDALDQVATLEQNISNKEKRDPSGIIRLSAPEGLAIPYLLDLIESFRVRYPDVTFDLLLDNAKTDFVAEGTDIAIRLAIALEDSSLIIRKLGETEFVLLAAPSYLMKRGEPENLEDLSSHDCISFGASKIGDGWPVLTAKGIRKIRQPWKMVVNHTQSHKEAIKRGMGVGLLPRIMAEDMINEGLVRQISLDVEFPKIGIYLVYPSRDLQPRRVRLFLDHVYQAFAV
ncbi:LysR family transcriptional regulator [Curvivirga aplysinae]|uniref:LysR family transcriptional regulator n=1 Tax=Curvivirga aplysinae TaxID=2529852 RepID=UPI0012BC51E4|nr:LysR family transcriptional regulator [Curvivirga aplysinae]MTI09542.1 LysR family transcriptional regulator [Curvivirga aplysinae]